jgi:hypothetical protein
VVALAGRFTLPALAHLVAQAVVVVALVLLAERVLLGKEGRAVLLMQAMATALALAVGLVP